MLKKESVSMGTENFDINFEQVRTKSPFLCSKKTVKILRPN